MELFIFQLGRVLCSFHDADDMLNTQKCNSHTHRVAGSVCVGLAQKNFQKAMVVLVFQRSSKTWRSLAGRVYSAFDLTSLEWCWSVRCCAPSLSSRSLFASVIRDRIAVRIEQLFAGSPKHPDICRSLYNMWASSTELVIISCSSTAQRNLLNVMIRLDDACYVSYDWIFFQKFIRKYIL